MSKFKIRVEETPKRPRIGQKVASSGPVKPVVEKKKEDSFGKEIRNFFKQETQKRW